MEFYLTYDGPLKANGKPKEKQVLRRVFHKQLKELWNQPPLKEFGMQKFFLTNDKENKKPIFKNIDKFNFVSIVNQRYHLIAELNITMLRPEPPGSIVTQGGDIDNRLKTLFDSFKMPKEKGEIPKNDLPQEDENPFFCLLEDDNLITKLNVRTGFLLQKYEDSSHVNLLIHVQTKATELTWENIGLV